MDTNEIKQVLQTKEYDFLRANAHLGENIILLGLGGSYAYGTNVQGSDLDVRGCALNTSEEILLGQDFEQVVERDTDTTVYSFSKLVKLLISCNPNTVELLGLRPDHYLYLSPVGQQILDNAELFLSRKAIHSFCGFAYAQLRRLDNKAARLTGQQEQEQHILNSIQNASVTFREQFFTYPEDAIRLYLDKALSEDRECEIFMDVHLTHYPLRDYRSMWSSMNNIVTEYSKTAGKTARATEKGKLAKHMMHLVRLYYMSLDIMEQQKVVTYREQEHDLLMSIRNGDYLDENRQPTPEFFALVEELQKKVEYAKKHTELPERPNLKRIQEFVLDVHGRVVRGTI